MPRTEEAPERLRWAVELLAIRPRDHILEIGCGRGVAAELVCAQLDSGRYVGIDRSATAITAAAKRGVDCIDAAFHVVALEDAGGSALGRFDTVFAVNVNLFWVRPASDELRLIANFLLPGGSLHLVFDPPTAGRAAELEGKLGRHLRAAGFDVTFASRVTPAGQLLAVSAQPQL